jgi:hypothetical protein
MKDSYSSISKEKNEYEKIDEKWLSNFKNYNIIKIQKNINVNISLNKCDNIVQYDFENILFFNNMYLKNYENNIEKLIYDFKILEKQYNESKNREKDKIVNVIEEYNRLKYYTEYLHYYISTGKE